MPGQPIFQDSPNQLKVQIYVLDSIAKDVVPLKVDGSGKLAIDIAEGSVVSLAAGTNIDTVTTVGTVTNEVKIVNGATGLDVGLNEGTEVALANGTNVIGKVEIKLVFTDVDTFGGSQPLTIKTIGSGSTVYANEQNISQQTYYNWFIKNNGTAANQNITIKVELSPDGTNWIDDTGTSIKVQFGNSQMIPVTNFMKYARFVITGGTAATTVISCFQARH